VIDKIGHIEAGLKRLWLACGNRSRC